ncbi:MAG: asparagine synthase (glutamine-hydrolyzing) [Gemmatimonadaceae bacterium]|jgi:asparagine synthase (glutamine-hydrolysing)|nr:asparagine synthase (glutamine-hydrolyzing) [Gemmatimonadaceae bacterium]
MCGLNGFFGARLGADSLAVVRRMADTLAHRGPDAEGAWVDEALGVGLGHRRLSILDLSPEGAQPMHSASGRYVTVFNGEAYNFAPIRAELESFGHRFRGHSDTEVLLAAFDRWGIEAAIPRFAGMFAIAVWDREERRVVLARDRLGEKPLYLGQVGGSWVFASELKAMRAFPGWSGRVEPRAVAQLLRFGYIQAPLTIFEGISKVRPGTMVVLRHGMAPQEVVYWSALDAAQRGLAHPIRGSDEEIADELEALLRPIVKDEMVSDVPLGAFLSGGIDSSLIVALMQAQSSRPVRTYTIGFDDARFNEADFARAVAEHLRTEHTELHVSGTDALQFIDRLPEVYDEPMADSSQMPTMLVSQLTRQHVTVALSGDGGDELFGGYTHYRNGGTAQRLRDGMPAALRAPIASALGLLPDPPPAFMAKWITDGDREVGDRPANALTRAGLAIGARDERELHKVLISQMPRPWVVLRADKRARAGAGDFGGAWLPSAHPIAARMLFDATCYMADDILVKVDRAAMAFSLETRAPLLDHRVFEFAWRVPLDQKIRQGVGKLPLRHVLYRHVPRALIDRPKRGFAVPLAEWLRGPLREWAADLLADATGDHGEWLERRAVMAMWTQHLDGTANYADRLWTILSLAAFLRRNARAI